MHLINGFGLDFVRQDAEEKSGDDRIKRAILEFQVRCIHLGEFDLNPEFLRPCAGPAQHAIAEVHPYYFRAVRIVGNIQSGPNSKIQSFSLGMGPNDRTQFAVPGALQAPVEQFVPMGDPVIMVLKAGHCDGWRVVKT